MGEDVQKKIQKVDLDSIACIGCGNCSVLCPEAFEFVEEKNYSIVRDGAHCASDERLLYVAGVCPVAVICLYDGKGELVSPTDGK